MIFLIWNSVFDVASRFSIKIRVFIRLTIQNSHISLFYLMQQRVMSDWLEVAVTMKVV